MPSSLFATNCNSLTPKKINRDIIFFMFTDDTIAAIATPPGIGGIGIIRISGRRALEAMQRLFKNKTEIPSPEPNKLYYGDIIDLKSNTIDSGYAVFMKAPYSYTGEDTVEFQIHSSPAVLSKIMRVLNEIGLRTAEPGEFTRRAFLNNKIDLLQAEAVLDLVNSSSENASRIALSQLRGDLSQRINMVKEDIIKILSNLDAIIDFPESVNGELDIKETETILNKIKGEMESLLNSYKAGRAFREGLLIQIVGKPNVGKSSLFNAILGKERAIVHSKPGTTRDYIEEELILNGILLRLVDSAGIWNSQDEVEDIGIRKAMEIFHSADAFIFVIDASQQLSQEDYNLVEDLKNKRGIISLNKCDLKHKIIVDGLANKLPGWQSIYTSAKTGEGIRELKRALQNISIEITPPFEPGVITRSRHYECLSKSLAEINNAISNIKNSAYLVVSSDAIRRALKHLGELTGEELNHKVLDRIFSEFCIGK